MSAHPRTRMSGRPRGRLAAAAVVAAVVATACTGSGTDGQADEPVVDQEPPDLEEGVTKTEPATPEPDETQAASPTPTETAEPAQSTDDSTTGDATTTTGGDTAGGETSTGGDTGGGETSTTGGDTTGGDTGSDGTNGGDGGDDQPPEADLYGPERNRVGITEDEIRLCGHAALIFADAFDTNPEDLNVYWEEVNQNGGVFGREVEVEWNDDQYSPDEAVAAAEACKESNPFLMIGGIGFDQIPAVRNWAENNEMLYLHHIAVAPEQNPTYSFSMQPTVDETGRAFGEHITRRYSDEKVGILWRQSENWEPGHRQGLQFMEQHDVEVVADLPVENGQGVYTQEIQELRSKGAEVVWIWENALAAGQVINQADTQAYRPKWVVFPFQTTLDILQNQQQAIDKPIDGVATWPAYVQGGYGDAYSQHGLPAEIERFEAAVQEHTDSEPNQILWQVWIGNKALHELLQRCGEDCNRNRVAGIMQFGLNTRVDPNCTVDFTRPDSFGGHIGGFEFRVQETFPHPQEDKPGWKTVQWCSEHLR